MLRRYRCKVSAATCLYVPLCAFLRSTSAARGSQLDTAGGVETQARHDGFCRCTDNPAAGHALGGREKVKQATVYAVWGRDGAVRLYFQHTRLTARRCERLDVPQAQRSRSDRCDLVQTVKR